ncbi:hypothetical protein MBLNU13_g11074t1 [Cladosporium sp. NU13]
MSAASSSQDARKSLGRNTPGRRGRTGNQYFDVGKVGRKTGIVLIDTGVRDEHGLEPMSGIFSSPMSPEKIARGTSSSNAMQLQESEYIAANRIATLSGKYNETNQLFPTGSAPDVDETLNLRKTPRFPPPRASTPRHTNIGSPKRMSSARPQSRKSDMASDISPNRAYSQPPANRVLNFGRQNVRADTGSPFKPTKVLRRSFGGVQRAQTEDPAMSPPGSYSKPELPTVDTNIINEEDEDAQEVTDQEVEADAGADVHSDHSDESYGGAAQVYMEEDDQPADDAPPMFHDEDDFYNTQGDAEADEVDITEALEHAEVLLQTTPTIAPNAKKSRGRPRVSERPTEASIIQQSSPTGSTASNSKKRSRAELEDNEDDQGNDTMQSIEQSQNEVSHASASSQNPAKKARGRPRKNQIPVLQDPTEQTVPDADETLQSVEEGDNEPSQVSTATATDKPAKRGRGRPPKKDVTIIQDDDNEQTIDPADVAYGDSYLAPVIEDDEAEAAPASPRAETKPEKKTKAQKATKSKKAPKERDPNQSMRRTPSASPGKVDRDRTLVLSPSKRAGSVSNVNLRATTPFEDAHQRLSRSGRPIMAPLKHWAGESYVWKNGEVEGIIRADEVKTPRGSKKKTTKTKRRVPRAGKRGNDLDIIAEESDTESTVPDDWEEQIGVIAGTVAAWDPDAQQGNPELPIREDIAYASSSIVTRDVAGSAFQYAKIMTLPFFGSGIVELPPEGFKRAKNSRKMQMVFFVHQGKVLVTVGPPALENGGTGNDAETNEFAISKGGVWVVPRVFEDAAQKRCVRPAVGITSTSPQNTTRAA